MKHYTVTTYGCAEWLCRTGRIRGELVFHDARRGLSMADVKAAVVQRYQLHSIDMVSARKSFAVSHPRQLSMYLCKQLTPKSLPEIGRAHGGRDHTTVIHAVRQVERRRTSDPDLNRAIVELSTALSHHRYAGEAR